MTMPFKFVVLYTDVVIWLFAVGILFYAWHVRRNEDLLAKWRRVAFNARTLVCACLLSFFFLVALSDSVHVRWLLPDHPQATQKAYSPKTESLLDLTFGRRIAARERSYSEPFALFEFDKTSQLTQFGYERKFSRLTGAGIGVKENEHIKAIARDFAVGSALGSAMAFGFLLLVTWCNKIRKRTTFSEAFKSTYGKGNYLRVALFTWAAIFFLAGVLHVVWPHWHVFGTDTTGNDVLFVGLKSIRTAIVIGSLATFSMLPFAILLGMMAGYFKGWIDDVIQYIYTTLSSIPSVLLIAASVLMIQVFIDKNPTLYETGLERADLRLFLLAGIIGVTGWAGLARLLRAETMKVAAMDYIAAARAFGVSPLRILMRHVFPNVAHIVLIVSVLDFSGIVLYEAVLSYVGVGVDPVIHSFGSMINAAASEMSRTPVIWWNLLACFVLMVCFVLATNLFASGVRDAFDPRTQGEDHA